MIEAIEAPLVHEADVNARNFDKHTPLHITGLTSPREVVNLLVHYEADTNTRNLDGETPIKLESCRQGYRHPKDSVPDTTRQNDLFARDVLLPIFLIFGSNSIHSDSK
jgi:hypothetical protein